MFGVDFSERKWFLENEKYYWHQLEIPPISLLILSTQYRKSILDTKSNVNEHNTNLAARTYIYRRPKYFADELDQVCYFN